MLGQLGGVVRGPPEASALQGLPRPRMCTPSTCRRQQLVDGVPDDGVGEPDPTGPVVVEHPDHEPGLNGLVNLVTGPRRGLLEDVEVDRTAEDGGRHEHVPLARGQLRKPFPDNVPYALGNGAPGVRGGIGQRAVLHEQADDLADEERVALGPVTDRRGHVVAHGDTTLLSYLVGDAAKVQSSQR